MSGDHERDAKELEVRTRALESLLFEKGLLDAGRGRHA